ncbi:hypothetical protein PSENEW3n2_00000613 [Picochlorum sp. SENEW3]|nr:hypothetical protein PSENEW3n2_00000613 [Picochlorum sp. SENEW3]WPT15533.1 hypothetical protein PSENEW3_00000613 [Picochlorum sp. SENEW3]
MSLRLVFRGLKGVTLVTYLYDINVCAKREEWTLSLAWSFDMYLYDSNICAKREEWTLSLAWSFGGMYLYDINVCAKREEWTLSLAWLFGGMYLYHINVCAKREEWTLSLAWSFGGVKRIYSIIMYVQSEKSGHCLWHDVSEWVRRISHAGRGGLAEAVTPLRSDRAFDRASRSTSEDAADD